MSDETIANSFRVTGRVQGVSFRAWTQGRAEARGLEGWVRNTSEGAVEGVVQGPAQAVDAFCAELRTGPPLARVDDVRLESRAPETLADFEVRP
jgi:acylphosphatase